MGPVFFYQQFGTDLRNVTIVLSRQLSTFLACKKIRQIVIGIYKALSDKSNWVSKRLILKGVQGTHCQANVFFSDFNILRSLNRISFQRSTLGARVGHLPARPR